VTGPIVFVGTGILIGPAALGVVELAVDEAAIRVLAEATLVLLLFTDAIRIDLTRLRGQVGLPARLLGIGLPLTVLAGLLVALGLFDEFGIWKRRCWLRS
jgi:NhaP-type Na+/H+ or K+/H+ antiporter